MIVIKNLGYYLHTAIDSSGMDVFLTKMKDQATPFSSKEDAENFISTRLKERYPNDHYEVVDE